MSMLVEMWRRAGVTERKNVGRFLAPLIATLLLAGCGGNVANDFPASDLARVTRDTSRGDGRGARRVQARDVGTRPGLPLARSRVDLDAHPRVGDALRERSADDRENVSTRGLVRPDDRDDRDRRQAARWRSGLPWPHGHACHSRPAGAARSSNPARWRSDTGRSALTGVHRGIAWQPTLTGRLGVRSAGFSRGRRGERGVVRSRALLAADRTARRSLRPRRG